MFSIITFFIYFFCFLANISWRPTCTCVQVWQRCENCILKLKKEFSKFLLKLFPTYILCHDLHLYYKTCLLHLSSTIEMAFWNYSIILAYLFIKRSFLWGQTILLLVLLIEKPRWWNKSSLYTYGSSIYIYSAF